jgi:hypothetical protein
MTWKNRKWLQTWNDEIQLAIEEKKANYRKYLQNNLLPKQDTAVLRWTLGYSPWVVESNKYSLSNQDHLCGEQPHSMRGDLVCAEHIVSKGVNLEKQSSVLQCKCHA